MTDDAPTREGVEGDWRGVLLNQSRVLVNTSMDALFHSVEFRSLCHSLILVHAYGVLQQALQRLAADGRFSCGSQKLGTLMKASEAQGLPWMSYEALWEGKEKRDDVAHEAKYLPQAEAANLVSLIEANLEAWGFSVRAAR